jgi:hypothetical protein
MSIEVDMGRFHRLVPEPQRDDRAFYTRLQQIHSHRVSQAALRAMLMADAMSV